MKEHIFNVHALDEILIESHILSMATNQIGLYKLINMCPKIP
jgi:hypothetical protein